jgi:HD-GYP domain-containing protein (c-di-GMP phosphodiesterase class II)
MASTHRDEISRLELLYAAHPEGLVFPHLADAYRRAGRYSQAEVVLSAGLRRHSEYSSAHVVMGRLRLDQGKRDEAREAFQRVLQLDPQNQVALEYLGELAAESGDLSEALALFQRLERFKPDGALGDRIQEIQRRLARQQATPPTPPRSGNGDSAARRPQIPPLHDPAVEPAVDEVVTETMAELYARQGLIARAIGVYRELLARNPGDPRLREKLETLEGEARPASVQGPTIGDYLGSLLAWRGSSGADPTPAPLNPQEAEKGPERASHSGQDAEVEAAQDLEPWLESPVSPTTPVPQPSALEPGPTPAPPAAESLAALAAGGGARATLIALADLLVGLLEYRDPFFRGSSSLTRLLAKGVVQELGLATEARDNLELAAVLRDLGRLALGGRLISSGERIPTQVARRRIERHVDLALELLEGIELPLEVRAAVRHHHERWDGGGYPDGLAGESIPIPARILAVVDSFAAMVSPRSYRVPRKSAEALKELQEGAGTLYDPKVVEALSRVLGRRDHPALGSAQRQHVLLVNPDHPGAVVTAAKLCSEGYLAEVATDVGAARDRLRRVPMAALVVSADAEPDDVAGFISTLRADPMFVGLPVVAVNADGVEWRVRLLEAGADVCFPPGVSYAELKGTLGALVRRTLRVSTAGAAGTGARSESAWLALQGDIRDFPLTWLLQVMKYDSRTAAIAIRTGQEEGVIYLRQGDAIHAQLRNGTRGKEALRDMLGWTRGRFTVRPDARPKVVTIRSSIMHLLLTQAVDEDHAAAGIFGAVSAGV